MRRKCSTFITNPLIGDQMVAAKGNPAHLTGKDARRGHHVAVNTLYEKTAYSLSDRAVRLGDVPLAGSAVAWLPYIIWRLPWC
jgi:hypothetical protein